MHTKKIGIVGNDVTTVTILGVLLEYFREDAFNSPNVQTMKARWP
jgi:hypothetical protein